MTERCILGVDPGLSGAIAFYFPSAPQRVAVEDMPVVNGKVDGAVLKARIAQFAPTDAIIELVGAMPGQGVTSMFRFGHGVGVVEGVMLALGIPFVQVTPGKWKKRFALKADKEAARALAIQTFPACAEHFARKKDHGRAEAALLAFYAANYLREVASC